MQHHTTEKKNLVTCWAGADVSKKTFDAAFLEPAKCASPADLHRLPLKTFPRTREGALQFLAWLDTHMEDLESGVRARAVMEATGRYSAELAEWIREERPSLQPAIVNAYQTSAFIKSLMLRNKTDGLEARALALYGAERRPEEHVPITGAQRKLREFSRHRDVLVADRVALRNRMKEGAETPLVRKSHKRMEKMLTKEIEDTEAEMKKVAKKDSGLKPDLDRLQTIYGVGFITAAVVFAELGDLRRFKRARQLTAFAGVSPRIYQSGTSVNGRPRMCKQGNSRVRQALYLAAITAIRGKNDLQRTYCRLVDEGKSRKAALGAVMRKLLTVMRALLISGKNYDPHWKTGGKLTADPVN